jgi:hypothetical protein
MLEYLLQENLIFQALLVDSTLDQVELALYKK